LIVLALDFKDGLRLASHVRLPLVMASFLFRIGTLPLLLSTLAAACVPEWYAPS
jgi:hypothetical protein